MNANVSTSGSLYGKMASVFVVVLLAFSSFSLLASAGSNDEQEERENRENEVTSGITLGEAIVSDQGVEAFHVANLVPEGVLPPVASVMADGNFAPAKQDAGAAKVLLVDDDGENWMSGPWIEASHVATALNDGGYSYDVYRAGRWGGAAKELPAGDVGLSMLDDYEAIIWYSGWNTQIFSSAETGILGDYLDGECGSTDSEFGDGDFCVPVTSRNMILLTQMTDWVDAYSGGFENSYLHSDTQSSSYLIVDGTSNPMKGVSGSIFENTEYSTDTAGLHYLDRPCGIKAFDNTATGAFWYDLHKGAPHGHEYHAVQFPGPNYAGGDGQAGGAQDHKAFHFADEIGVFGDRTERADFFATILGWMQVTKEQTQNVDIGIGGVDIPNHVQYWRSVESMVEVDIRITVTNYGMLPQASTAVHLKLKNEYGQVLFDSTFDTRAFPEGHPMNIPDSMQSGDSVVFTFNKTNDRYQRIYDGVNEHKARAVIFTSAGMDRLVAEVMHTGDQGSPNDYVQADVGIGLWIENGEHPDNEIGPSITIGDSDDNGANSLDHANFHRITSYDTDADGCGWAVDATTCVANGGSLNKTYGTVFMEGESSLAMSSKQGWYKSNSDGHCDWGDSSLGDTGCPKFTMEPNQDDWFVSPPLDLSGMEEVVVGMLFSGCLESGDYFRMQIKKATQSTWTNLINYSGFCPGEGAWYLWGGSNAKYQGYTLTADWFGADDTDAVQWRVQADADNDQVTESGTRPYNGWWIDEIVFRGTERITRDVAIGDITVDKSFNVEDAPQNSLWREVNATVVNAGESSWTELPVKMTVENLQGADMTGFMSIGDDPVTIPTLDGESTYGDIIADSSQNKVFATFRTPQANTYYMTVEALVPEGRDYFPWNNSMTVSFRVFDTFFFDDVDNPTDRSTYSWTSVNRLSGSTNSWKERDVGNDAYQGQYVWQYAKESGYDTSSANDQTTGGNSDDSLITQDEFDRDGDGTTFGMDVNVDLRAAFKPILSFAIKWDLAAGDRFEVRAATDFDSDQKISSGTWTVIKTYEGNCGCAWSSSDENTWIVEELPLDDFEGYQTWIDFRVVTASGGVNNGVMIDEVLVIGNEYRNNLDITDVVTDRFAASGGEHDLSVTVKGIGLEPQSHVTVTAVMTDSNGLRVWPKLHTFNYFTIPDTLDKGEIFTINPTTAGSDWVWGSGLSPGIYQMRITAWRDDEQQVHDENPANNVKTVTIVLGAALLTGDEWTTGSGWSEGSYVWNGEQDGSLTSDSFDVWNSKPFLVVEADYDLTDAHVKAQVRAGSSGAWYDIKWRSTDELSTLYSIPGGNYTVLPDRWTGSSSYDNATKQTFFADLGVVAQLSDGSGNLQDQYVRGSMQIRLTGTNTGSGDGGTFTAYYPSVFGLDDYSVDVKEISPTTQNGEPSSSTGDEVKRTYTVKVNNYGASSDSAVVDFVITVPDNSFVTLDDGTNAIMDSILQQGQGTVVAIKPISGSWGGGRDDTSGGDQTAYISDGGLITWPSATTEYTSSTGWRIYNPTKSNWDSVAGKPSEPAASNFATPGSVNTVSLEVTVGFAAWAPPGTYSVQADARSWSDYDNTFTSGDSDGQATMIIAKPDLLIGNDVRYISHATGWGESGVGWEKHTGEDDPYFSFMFEVLNAGTETVGTFKVGLLDFESNPLGVQVAIFWTGSGWAIDSTKTTAEGAEIVTEGNKKYITFQATAAQLGMSAGPGETNSGAYTFYLAVDTEDSVAESNENNNNVPITITAVREVNTVPSFSLPLMSMTLSGLLVAVGIALRQREEEE